MDRTERQSIRRWFSPQMCDALAAVLAVFAPVAAAQSSSDVVIMKTSRLCTFAVLIAFVVVCIGISVQAQKSSLLGKEISISAHLRDGQEYDLSVPSLVRFGETIFSAKWTIQEGGGRPNVKGTANGALLSDPSQPLVFPHNFNRISGPDSNSCKGCHNDPFEGGGGDRATLVFVLGQRFDFATFDHSDATATKGATDEAGQFVTLQSIANERRTIGMNGSGFIEMLARQMTVDLQSIRDSIAPGKRKALISKGVSFGSLARGVNGSWDTSRVIGLPAPSLSTATSDGKPTLLILPFHQSGAVVSLRQFTNNAFTQHFGMQPEERFGAGVDEDGDGFVNELTRADITAATIYQATLPLPGRVISEDPEVERAVRIGEQKFEQIGCGSCHIPKLPLVNNGWVYTEPGPYNPAGNLQSGEVSPISVDLTSSELPGPRLKPDGNGVVWVPAFTDLKLHDITSGLNDPNREPLDQNEPTGTEAFFAGNGKFITRKLWGAGNSGPYMHHGKFTTMREAILAHSGEALQSRQAFQALSPYDRDSVIELLKSLQILPPGTRSLVINETGQAREWSGLN
jgi:hypothetical protein